MEQNLTFEELDDSLPNGLHDAELLGIAVDYRCTEAVLSLNLDLSDGDQAAGDETYREAQLRFSGLAFVIVDVPATEDDYRGVSAIDAGSGLADANPRELPKIPSDCFLCWIFVVDWNAFIHIAAANVELEWLNSGV